MRETAAVVVTYNRIALLKECIAHLQNQTVPIDIIVIDNASTDGTSEWFTLPQDNVFYFNTGANLGGAGGFHFGLRKAVEMGYPFAWIMDDDTIAAETAHEKLLEADARLNGQYGFLSGKVLWKNGSLCNMNIPKITKWKKLDEFEHNHAVQYASFVSLFLKTEIIKEFGLPYKEFFIWGDDWEFTRRISKRRKCYYIADSVVNHFCKDNNGSSIIAASPDNLSRHRYSYRNDVVIYRQDGLDGAIFLLVRTLIHCGKIILFAEGKSKKLKVMFKALSDGIRFKPTIEKAGDYHDENS